ncbi:MAG: Cobyrinic acid ac-diamide synthase [Deltaproteobacteria bacterium]|nr:Cobyrinic acid ac-diamide synthase [Deltaproteobacteria bacterium]
MPKICAFAGKGGVGKTTISAMLVRFLMEKTNNEPILAVDADPNSNLNEMLGAQVNVTIGEARESIKKEVPAGMAKDTWIEMKVHEAVIENKGYDLLVMGRPEGTGCYCAANSLAKKHIDLLKENYAYVVIDNEAGMEHMSRLVTTDVDHLFVVSDASARGLLTAKRILELITELNLNIAKTHVLINRLQDKDGLELAHVAEAKGMAVTGVIRYDSTIVEGDVKGYTVFSLNGKSMALQDAYSIFEKTLWGKE